MSECEHEEQIDIVLKICNKCSQTRNEITLKQEVDGLRESKERIEKENAELKAFITANGYDKDYMFRQYNLIFVDKETKSDE